MQRHSYVRNQLLAWSLAVVTGSASAALAQGTGSAATSEVSYKVVTGIIGISAAIVALAIAVKVLRKTTLESRKLSLRLSRSKRH